LLSATVAHSQVLQDQEIDRAQLERSMAAQALHEKSLLRASGVRGLGVGIIPETGQIAIHVFVKRGAPTPVLPSTLEGVPVKVIESNGFIAHNGPCDLSAPCHARAYRKPVPMGASTSNISGVSAGTLGFRVHRLGDQSAVGYLTVNHVAAASADFCPAQVNPAALPPFSVNQCQPGLFDSATGTCSFSRRIGGLVQVMPLVMGGAFLNTVDAAFVHSKRGCVSRNILDIGVPTAHVSAPRVGDVVRMSGRTSGLKINRVITINTVVDVDYEAGCGTARFVGQVITEPVNSESASLPGDSGAPVVKVVGGLPVPVGINFAGDGVLSVVTPIPTVLNAMGVAIDTQPDAPAAISCLD
jgi:hypothetical protein